MSLLVARDIALNKLLSSTIFFLHLNHSILYYGPKARVRTFQMVVIQLLGLSPYEPAIDNQ